MNSTDCWVRQKYFDVIEYNSGTLTVTVRVGDI
uniref:Uncharacterized protein n=1 Tax=Lepeophtheirus salmonis TaxID=72036 RepID=A0A0K2VFT1_LEPSM